MATYCFACDCGNRFEIVRPMKEGGGWEADCPACGKKAGRDLGGERQATIGDNYEFASTAMGVIPDHAGRLVNAIPGESYDARGRLRIKSREHYKRMASRLGLAEAGSYG